MRKAYKYSNVSGLIIYIEALKGVWIIDNKQSRSFSFKNLSGIKSNDGLPFSFFATPEEAFKNNIALHRANMNKQKKLHSLAKEAYKEYKAGK